MQILRYNRRWHVRGSSWLVRVAMLIAIVLGLIAVVAGFWFMAPVVMVIGLVIAIVQTRRIESR
jgi:hypothetical protein